MQIYDSHVHPLDITGVVGPESYSRSGNLLIGLPDGKNDYSAFSYKKPTFQENLKYSRLSCLLTKFCYRVAPLAVKSSILNFYKFSGEKRLLDEMDYALIDKAVFLPVAPNIETQQIFRFFKNDRFILTGAVDVRKKTLNEINEDILYQIKSFSIKGVKLHPNFQGFYPEPDRNNTIIAEKLRLIYKLAERNKLFIIFHAGASNILSSETNQGKNYGILENFFDKNNKSEVFENYKIPIILAHLGQYALVHHNLRMVKKVSDNFPHIFFDTAGISPFLIKKFLDVIDSRKLIFGSDALYGRMVYNLKFCLEAINQTSKNKFWAEENTKNIFGVNFQEKILNFKY